MKANESMGTAGSAHPTEIDGTHPIPPLQARLADLAALLRQLPNAAYAQTVAGLPGTVGGHVRHCLDHVDVLLAASESVLAASSQAKAKQTQHQPFDATAQSVLPTVNHDHRRRGTPVETDRKAALAALAIAEQALSVLAEQPAAVFAMAVTFEGKLVPGGPTIQTPSSLAREWAFVLSHTIHHQATIGALAMALGVCPPAGFGFAPATPQPDAKPSAAASD